MVARTPKHPSLVFLNPIRSYKIFISLLTLCKEATSATHQRSCLAHTKANVQLHVTRSIDRLGWQTSLRECRRPERSQAERGGYNQALLTRYTVARRGGPEWNAVVVVK